MKFRLARPAAAVVVIGLAVGGYLWWDRATTHSGGPVRAVGGAQGGSAEVGKERFFVPLGQIFNSSPSPARLEKVRFLGVTDGLEIRNFQIAPDGPLLGPRVIPGASHDGTKLVDAALEITANLRATRPGVLSYRAIEVTYRHKHRRYRNVGEAPYYLCTAAAGESFPGRCPGDAEGRFGDGVVQFPAPS
jgi:hypothetical protein